MKGQAAVILVSLVLPRSAKRRTSPPHHATRYSCWLDMWRRLLMKAKSSELVAGLRSTRSSNTLRRIAAIGPQKPRGSASTEFQGRFPSFCRFVFCDHFPGKEDRWWHLHTNHRQPSTVDNSHHQPRCEPTASATARSTASQVDEKRVVYAKAVSKPLNTSAPPQTQGAGLLPAPPERLAQQDAGGDSRQRAPKPRSLPNVVARITDRDRLPLVAIAQLRRHLNQDSYVTCRRHVKSCSYPACFATVPSSPGLPDELSSFGE